MWKNYDLIPVENKKPVEIVQLVKEKEIITSVIIPSSLWSSNTNYIGSPDFNIWNEFKSQTASHVVHESSAPFNNLCLGCLCGEGSHSKSSYNFSQTYCFSSGGKLILKTAGSEARELKIPQRGGKVKLEVNGNKISLFLEREGIY